MALISRLLYGSIIIARFHTLPQNVYLQSFGTSVSKHSQRAAVNYFHDIVKTKSKTPDVKLLLSRLKIIGKPRMNLPLRIVAKVYFAIRLDILEAIAIWLISIPKLK